MARIWYERLHWLHTNSYVGIRYIPPPLVPLAAYRMHVTGLSWLPSFSQEKAIAVVVKRVCISVLASGGSDILARHDRTS